MIAEVMLSQGYNSEEDDSDGDEADGQLYTDRWPRWPPFKGSFDSKCEIGVKSIPISQNDGLEMVAKLWVQTEERQYHDNGNPKCLVKSWDLNELQMESQH